MTTKLEWDYSLGHGIVCRSTTECGVYTIEADQDRVGEPLVLEFYNSKVPGSCAINIEVDVFAESIEDFQRHAQKDYDARQGLVR